MFRKLTYGGLALWLALASQGALAAVQPEGLLDQVADRFLQASATWGTAITGYASWLFWTLVLISMVWTFGMMALRKADLGEFFAEFIRFTVTTGFFWWLLLNGPRYAMDIINSLRMIGAQASGQSSDLTPSRPIDIGWDIVVKAAENYSVINPIDNLSIFFITAAILACMAIVAANVLLTLVNAWILAYAGVFVLGFGGSRWTSDIAINYFRSVLAIALKLMTMTLLVGVALSIMDSYYANLSKGAPVNELLLVFVVALVLTILVHSVPNVIAGLIPGGGGAASGVGSFSGLALAGTAMAAGGMAGTAAAAAAGAVASGAASAAGGASAVMSAVSKASENVSAGTDTLAGMFSSGGDAAAGGDETGNTPFAQAAGFAAGPSFAASAAKAGRIAVDAGANLAKGVGEVAKAKAGSMREAAHDRVSETTGGKIAAAIDRSGGGTAAAASPTFTGNSLSGQSADIAAEVASFVNRSGAASDTGPDTV